MTLQEIDAYYQAHIAPFVPPNTPDPDAIAAQIYTLTGTPASVTGGVVTDFNRAVRGLDVRDNITFLSMLIRAYNDLVTDAAADVPQNAATRISSLESLTSDLEDMGMANDPTATGDYAHAEGNSCEATGDYSHAEGNNTEASGSNSHAEGDRTVASGNGSHAEGRESIASGSVSHAEGRDTVAGGIASHAEGIGTVANHNYQHVQGKYNDSTSDALFVIGNGSDADNRSNAFVVEADGDTFASGDMYANEDKKLATEEFANTYFKHVGKTYTRPASANDLIDNGIYFNQITQDYPNGTITDVPYPGSAGWLDVTRTAYVTSTTPILQIYFPFYGTNGQVPKRRFRRQDFTWTDWIPFVGIVDDNGDAYIDGDLGVTGTIASEGMITSGTGFYEIHSLSDIRKLATEVDVRLVGKTYTPGTSADNIINNGVYFSGITTDYPNGEITDIPSPMGWLEVTRNKSNAHLTLQIFYPYSSTLILPPKRRFRKLDDTWSDWAPLGENVTNNNSYSIQQNTYNVTATPTISTGVPYVLTSTGDTTDRTADIAAVLNANGACQLGTGTFYVTNLSLGSNQALYGSGVGATTIRMIDNETGAAVSLGTHSSIADLTIDGGLAAGSVPSTNGGRHGIAWGGTYISPENPGTSPYRGQISNVKIYGFSGAAIICSNTSMGVNNGLNVVNVNIYRCWSGIYIPIYSEYHRFTNIEIDGCYYGVINNGGNNMFANCGFNSNQIGFYIDNSSGQSPNNSHGSAVGCTFNHSGSNSGTAIKLDGVTAGYVFNACQIFYGLLDIKDSVGVNFNSCNFGSSVPVSINGGGLVLFSSSIFINTPSVTKTNAPIVAASGCYLRNGSTVTI